MCEALDLSPTFLLHLFELHAARPTAARAAWSSDDEVAASADREAWLPYANRVISGAPADGLAIVVAFCDAAPDDDSLCWVGVVLLEPLLDRHAKTIISEFETQARRRPALRKALSCCVLHLGSRRLEARLGALARSVSHEIS
jgi:hypothetical protein